MPFKRPAHRKIAEALASMDSEALRPGASHRSQVPFTTFPDATGELP